ncbi:hypothetical protein [Paenibacillus radicis (ex Gao et al. 2016)]|uniref:hypothetical protein n=1 Tax=Paenibacillus radicis (ex Gao et al. 2016) TaxID=1737354 RepID=UPI00166E11DB|nr:hypothetical protein [Paenibacillus radicis (ex Gao et al. 2016)]
MRALRKKGKWIAIAGLAVLVVFLSLFAAAQRPLKADGITTIAESETLIIGLVNHGFWDIKLTDVAVNGKWRPAQEVQLIVSYTLHLVAGSGLEEDPNIKFVAMDAMKIHPKLSTEEVQKYKGSTDTPIGYGIRISSEDKIEQITIRYNYMGLPFTKTMTVDQWPASNF